MIINSNYDPLINIGYWNIEILNFELKLKTLVINLLS
jgi:hypothetical protein